MAETKQAKGGNPLDALPTAKDLMKQIALREAEKASAALKAQNAEEAGSLAAAVATIAARDYRKAVSALDRTQERKARPFSRPDKWAGRALLSCLLCWILVPLRTYSRLAGEIGRD